MCLFRNKKNTFAAYKYDTANLKRDKENKGYNVCVPPCVSFSASENEYTDIQHNGIQDAGRARKPLWTTHYGADLQSGI